MLVGVYALRPLQALTATVGDLVDTEGHKIPATCLDLRSVRYMPVILGRNAWYREAYILEKKPTLIVPAGESVFFWLTVYVPPQTPGKLYRGQVVLKVDGFPEQRVPVSVAVLPFALDETKKWFAMSFTLGNSGQPAQGDPYHFREEFINFREHGMNHMAYCQMMPDHRRFADGKYVFDFDSLPSFTESHKNSYRGRMPVGQLIRTGVACGLDRAYFPNLHGANKYTALACGFEWNTPEADQFYREYFKAWWEEGKKRNWPPIIYNIADEARAVSGDLKVAVRLAGLLKEGCPQLATSAFCIGQFNGDDDLGAYGKLLDYVLDGPYSQTYLDKVKVLGKKHMTYNQARPNNRPHCRYSQGFLLETTGFLGHQQFRQMIIRKDGKLADSYRWYPKGGYDGKDDTAFYTYIFPTKDGLLNSPAIEAMREGVDDSRYIETLRNLLAVAERNGSADVRQRAKAPREEFQAVLAALSPFDGRGTNCVSQLMREVGPEGLDVARFRIANLILRLRAK